MLLDQSEIGCLDHSKRLVWILLFYIFRLHHGQPTLSLCLPDELLPGQVLLQQAGPPVRGQGCWPRRQETKIHSFSKLLLEQRAPRTSQPLSMPWTTTGNEDPFFLKAVARTKGTKNEPTIVNAMDN